ncbi:MAG: hypothetical protein R3F60_24210 [bacterium]
MRMQGLRLVLGSPEALADEDIDVLWRLRARLIDLKPEVDPADDRAAFGVVIRRAHRVARMLDAAGDVVAFQDLAVHIWPRLLVLQSEYGFCEPRWRGHPLLPLMGFGMVVPAWARHGRGRRAWFVGDAYPTGFRPFVHGFPQVHLAGEPVSEELEALLAWLPDHLYGGAWDPVRQRVCLRTLPPRPPMRDGRDVEMLARYERVNPAWAEGYAAFLVLPLDRRLWAGLRTVQRRLGRRFKARQVDRGGQPRPA